MLKEFREGFWIDPKAVTCVSKSIGFGASDEDFKISVNGGPFFKFPNEEEGARKTYQEFIAWLQECAEEERELGLKTFERLMDGDPILTAKFEDWLKGIEE